jgi:dipeptidyl aminopeptidase/acylaminoacyl peptidase
MQKSPYMRPERSFVSTVSVYLAIRSKVKRLTDILPESLAICFLLSCFVTLTWGQQIQAPIPIEEALSAQSFPFRAPIDLSPDGGWVAYTLERQLERKSPIAGEKYIFYTNKGVPLESIGSAVWVANVKSGESRRLTGEGANSWGPSWSPDGRRLAFYSDRSGQVGLWLWDRTSNDISRVSEVIARPFFQYEVPQWTPDGKKILIKVLPEGVSIEDAANLMMDDPRQQPGTKEGSPTVTVYASLADLSLEDADRGQLHSRPPNALLNMYLTDLALIDVSTGSVQRLARRRTPTAYSISPDGLHVALMNYNGRESDKSLQDVYDIILISTAAPNPRVIASKVRMSYGLSVSWSPDGRYLCYMTSGPSANGDCYIAPVSGGSARNITEGSHPNFGGQYRQPLWGPGGQTIYLIGDNNLWEASLVTRKLRQVTSGLGREVLEIVSPGGKGRIWSTGGGQWIYLCTKDNKTKEFGFYRIDLITGKCYKLIEQNKTYLPPFRFSIDVSDDGKSIVYVGQDAQHPSDIWIADAEFTSLRRVTQTNPQLDKYVMGTTRFIEWRGEDGEELKGTLLLPAGYQENLRYPMIVEVYGGRSGSNAINQFGLIGPGVRNAQLLATRGYIVFVPDMPLSFGAPMRSIAKTVLPGVDKVIELGIADPDRIGVTGQSHGGYCVLALIVQTGRFKAAVSRAGFGNLFSMYGLMRNNGSSVWMAWAEEGQGNLGGTPWEFRERYIENSPVLYLDKVTTPLMIVHGALDTAVPVSFADEVFVGLRRLKKEVVYLKYHGEEHYEPTFSSANAIHYFNQVIAWFDKKLKNTTTSRIPHQSADTSSRTAGNNQ